MDLKPTKMHHGIIELLKVKVANKVVQGNASQIIT